MAPPFHDDLLIYVGISISKRIYYTISSLRATLTFQERTGYLGLTQRLMSPCFRKNRVCPTFPTFCPPRSCVGALMPVCFPTRERGNEGQGRNLRRSGFLPSVEM